LPADAAVFVRYSKTYLEVPMPTRRTSISLDPAVEKLAKEQAKEHKTTGMTDYLRGLVILDKLLTNGGEMQWEAPAAMFPMWAMAAFDLEIQNVEGKALRVRMKKKPEKFIAVGRS
jgi:hypothetical protein